jgi:hypothetical protein
MDDETCIWFHQTDGVRHRLDPARACRFGTEFVPQTVDLSLTAGGTTKGGFFGRPLSFLFAWIKCRNCWPNLVTVVPAVPFAARSKSGPRHVIGLRVVGISRFRAAPGARAAIN